MSINPTIPPGRGRWRLTLHARQFSAPTKPPTQTGIAELVDARSVRLEQNLNTPAQLTFTLDGRSQSALEIRELQHDVIAWRYNEDRVNDEAVFFGPVTQSEDQITEQAHTINFTCHDYLALLSRRYLTGPSPVVWNQSDQDNIAMALLARATQPTTGNGTSLLPGGFLPINTQLVAPNNALRLQPSGVIRDRTYLGNQEILAAIDDLAHVQGGFDYDFMTVDYVSTSGSGALRIWYPQQGVTRSDVSLVYGDNVAGVTRTVNSSDYSNYVRVLGNNQQSDQTLPQLYADAWNSDATSGTAGAVGTWMTANNASDVNQLQTLVDQANGTLALDGILIPSYSLTMRPDHYHRGYPNIGDTVPLVIQSGRLNVSTTVRVLGITYSVNDDAALGEDVALTVGRPAVTLAHILLDARSDIDALARR